MINFFLHIFDVLQKRRSLARWLLAGITVILMAMMASLTYNENIYDFLPVSGNEQKAIMNIITNFFIEDKFLQRY